MVPSEARIIAQCTVKVLVLSSSADRPELWDNTRVNEQAANVKPCSLILLYQSDTVRLHLEDKSQGKVYFHSVYDQVDYHVHSETWHTLRLSDDRCFGLVFVQDEFYHKFLQAFSLICRQVNDVWECNYPVGTENKELQDSAVHSHALPSRSRSHRKLALDVSASSGEASLSLASPLTFTSMQGAASARGSSHQPAFRGKAGIGEYVLRLQEAIASGDTNLAKRIAETLSQKRANLAIDVATEKLAAQKAQEIFIKICVEDRDSSGTEFHIKVPTTMKIGELKKKMLLEHGFALELQKWIIGKRIAKDEQTLAQCGASLPGSTIYLYLLSRQSVVPASIEPPALQRQHTQIDPHLQRELQRQILDDKPDFPPPLKPARREEKRNVPTGAASSREGWPCKTCTFVNFWTREACGMCDSSRPADLQPPPDFIIPKKERDRLEQVTREQKELRKNEEVGEVSDAQRQARFLTLISADQEQDLIPNTEAFECAVCMDEIGIAEGVVLRDCLHKNCRGCLRSIIETCDTGDAKCPYIGDDFSCSSTLQHREVKALVDEEVFQSYLERSMRIAESRAADSYHCKTPDCQGWCLYEDNINKWTCGLCDKENCLTCKAIHQGKTCRQYQSQMENLAATDKQAQKTLAMIKGMLDTGQAMRCPSCDVIIQKKEGCDWVQCSMCLTEICWVTKGPRWGHNGLGDTSGGCHCLEDGETRCAPECINCH